MSKTSTGARVIFEVGGTPVAYANSVNYSSAHAHQPVDIMGQPEPAEYAETGYTVNFTVTMFRVSTKGAQSVGLRPVLENLMVQPELTASLVDKVTGATLFKIERVKCTQEDFSVDARNLGNVTLSFVGIRQDEENVTTNNADARAGEQASIDGIGRLNG